MVEKPYHHQKTPIRVVVVVVVVAVVAVAVANECIWKSWRVFWLLTNVSVFNQHILDVITKIRVGSKRSDAESISITFTLKTATNVTLQDVQDKV